MRISLLWVLSLVVVAAAGCRRLGGIESKRAVQAAVEAHLKQRSSLLISNMTLEVGEVKFSGDRAEAEVIYQSKQSPDLAVRIRYILRKAGDHWEVESTSPMGGTPHGAANPTPPTSQPTTPAPQPSH